MSRLFEELDFQPTPIGDLSLRRRRIPALGERDIYEVKLGEEFLMSSLFVDAEVALADLGLAAVAGARLQVVVGGLGLGYTAEAALKDQRVTELLVVEALEPVIGWHRDGKVPLGRIISDDPRSRYIHGSFFDLALGSGFDPQSPGRKFHAILLDIDHSPKAHLNSANASFYTAENLAIMAEQLAPDGVFAMWSNEQPDQEFIGILERVFKHVNAQVVFFDNPFQPEKASNTVYVCNK
jgi:spermidine synthase